MYIFDTVESDIIERRSDTRFVVDLEGSLCGIPVRAENLSRSGALLSCPISNVPEALLMDESDAISLELALDTGIRSRVRIVYRKRRGDDLTFGVCFSAHSKEALASIAAYLQAIDARGTGTIID